MTPSPNIKDELRKLTDLQELDTKIYALTKELGEMPAKIKEIEDQFEAKKAHLKALEDSRQKQLVRQKEKEVELGGKEDAIKKTQSQLGQLKTNKEYQAKLAEIESLKADKSLAEEEILRSMDQVDLIKKDIEAEKGLLETEQKTFAEQKGVLTRRSAEIEGLLQETGGKRRILAEGIDKNVLKQYEHILQGRTGLALIRVAEGSCQGCFMKVPPQVINEIKMHDRLITCEVCSRILYIQEDLTP